VGKLVEWNGEIDNRKTREETERGRERKREEGEAGNEERAAQERIKVHRGENK
jgi:hypothetical protein